MTPFTLPTYSGQVLPNGETQTSLKPPAIQQGGQYNPHAYAQADAMQALKAAFRPQAYMPWFAQQAPAADWSKTYNTGAWMPPWVMNPGNVSTRGTNLGLGGMFGYTGNYGASPGPGVGTVGGSGGTWGGVPTPNPLTLHAARPGTTLPTPTTNTPVTQGPMAPNTDNDLPSSMWTGGSPTGQYTGIPTQTPTTPSGLPVYGSTGSTPTQNQQAATEMGNPLPPPGPSAPGDVYGFLDAFRFANPTSPEQTKFNQYATQYGPNDAWSYAMANAWNQLGPSLRNAMGTAGLSSEDANRVINTYGSRTKDLGDQYNYSGNWLANVFGAL